jgi:hypothetical protein
LDSKLWTEEAPSGTEMSKINTMLKEWDKEERDLVKNKTYKKLHSNEDRRKRILLSSLMLMSLTRVRALYQYRPAVHQNNPLYQDASRED